MILCSMRFDAVAVRISSWIRIFSPMISAVLAMIRISSPPLFLAARNTSAKFFTSSRPLLAAKSPKASSNVRFIRTFRRISRISFAIIESLPWISSISFKLTANAFSTEYPAFSPDATARIASLNSPRSFSIRLCFSLFFKVSGNRIPAGKISKIKRKLR